MAEKEIPPQIQNQLVKLQELQRQAQLVIAQRQQLELSVRELDRTITELEKADEKAVLYKSVGSLLVRAKDKAAVVSETKEQKETAEVRLQSAKRQEDKLKQSLTSLQKELQASLQGLQS
ncbi:MAG: prefoldin subunit beta [Methanobacteriota archaeon]